MKSIFTVASSILALSFVFSPSALADKHKLILSAESEYLLTDGGENALNATYFFHGAMTKGPRDYFGFNVRHDSISVGSSSKFLGINDAYVAAELNHKQWQFNANTDFGDNAFIEANHFFNKQFSAGISHYDIDGNYMSGTGLNAAYKTTFSGKDTIGARVYLFEDNKSVELSYFSPLSGGKYIKASLYLPENGDSKLEAKYYLNSETSIKASIKDSELDEVRYSQFLNNEWQWFVGIQDVSDGLDKVQVGIAGYF